LTCYGIRVGSGLGTLLLVALGVGAFATTAAAQTPPASCEVSGQNLFVRDVMSDIYYWYREIPDVDPATFDSPSAYLEAIRYRPLDETFSYIAPRTATEAFFSESQFVGFGFSSTLFTPGELRVTDVMPNSPAREVRSTSRAATGLSRSTAARFKRSTSPGSSTARSGRQSLASRPSSSSCAAAPGSALAWRSAS
jgi:hypothetical protein